jgi:poly-gamma-glutamate capsule biosynthesis protein CapA/YwtB (metallophosphatase superfamily)
VATVNSIRIAFVGDVRVTSGGAPLERLAQFFGGADIALATLETPLSKKGHPADKLFAFSCAPERASELAEWFRVLSLANNHSMDYGPEALLDTINQLQVRGILPVGAGIDQSHAWQAGFVVLHGIRIGFLAFTTLLPSGSRARERSPGVAGVRVRTCYEIDPGRLEEEPGLPPVVRTTVIEEDQEWLLNAVRRASKECDVLVVCAHMGLGADPGLLEFEPRLAQDVLADGAGCVVASHVHTLRGATHGRHGPVIYGLNSFIKQPTGIAPSKEQRQVSAASTAEGMVAQVEIEPSGCRLVAFRPLRRDQEGMPRVPETKDAAAICDQFVQLCGELGWSPAWRVAEGELLPRA